MQYFFTNNVENYLHLSDSIEFIDLEYLISWLANNNIFQLDTETLFVDDGPNVIEERKLVLIQLGDIEKKDQLIIDHTVFVRQDVRLVLKNLFEDTNNSFIAHNVYFEYTVIQSNLNIRVENLQDTFLMSKVLNGGLDLPKGYHSLAGCLLRFFDIEMDKSAQTTFDFSILNEKQLEYAFKDVVFLYDLFIKLKELLEIWDLWYLYYRVEREVIKVYADMGMNEMNFDTEYWLKISNTLKLEDKTNKNELNTILFEDDKLITYLKTSNHVLGVFLIQPKNSLNLNWGSNITRKKVLCKIIPDLITVSKFTKPELKKIYTANILSTRENKLLKLYMSKNFKVLNRYLSIYFKDWLYDHGYFLKKDEVLINWNSNIHKLYIFQYYYPHLENTNAKTLNRIYTNKLINKYKSYVTVHKKVTTYGEKFITKYVSKRNTIRPSGCRSVLHTGRIAFGILLQLPSEARYRNAISPLEKDYVFVDSDWKSAELVIAAYMAKETSFINAVHEGKDLHMMSASKIYADKWYDIAENNCTHVIDGTRCECKGHSELRNISKAVTFGLLFGSTHIGLSERLDIDRKEALELVDMYFKTFPNIKKFFDVSASEGMINNKVISFKPTSRIRFFHPPVNEGERQAIGRMSKNFKIQETNASMLKIALIKLRKYILKHNFPAKLNLPVHDQILSSCHKDRVNEWVVIQEKAMQEAADMFIEPGLLKTDTKILTKWTK